VNRRASLPGADELFRSTGSETGSELADAARPGPRRGRSTRSERRDEPTAGEEDARRDQPAAAVAEASGRVRHDQKITVYLTSQELLDLEQARLRLRAEFDIAVDRGRIVREGVAELLHDLHERGPDAALVRRLT
jgi:hypothetical protein